MRRTQERIAKSALARYHAAISECPYHAWSVFGGRMCTCRRRRARELMDLRRLCRGRA